MGACSSDDTIKTKKPINEKTETTKINKNNEKENENENIIEPTKKTSGQLKRRKSINAILLQNKPPARSDTRKLTFQRKQSIKYINEYKNDDQMHNKNYLLNRLAKN